MLGDSKRIQSHIPVPNWHRVRATTKTTPLGRVRLDVFKYAAVIQATRSTPSGTQLTQYPSSRETIRQRNSRSGGRLPHFIGRCSTRARAGPLARRYPRWTLREVPRNLPQLVRFESPRTPRRSWATDRRDGQIGKTRQLRGEQTAKSQEKHDKSRYSAIKQGQRPAKVDGEISRSTTSPDIAPSSKANVRRKSKATK